MPNSRIVIVIGSLWERRQKYNRKQRTLRKVSFFFSPTFNTLPLIGYNDPLTSDVPENDCGLNTLTPKFEHTEEKGRIPK